jgi:hypothetical protein
MLARMSASTGAVQWQTLTSTRGSMQPVRAGNTVWLKNEYVKPDNSVATRIMAFAATGTRTAPLRVIPLPQEMAAMNAGGFAVSGGTVVLQTWPSRLTGYRVPGT